MIPRPLGRLEWQVSPLSLECPSAAGPELIQAALAAGISLFVCPSDLPEQAAGLLEHSPARLGVPLGQTAEEVRRTWERAADRLGRVNLGFWHLPSPRQLAEDADMAGLLDLKEEGRIGAVGVWCASAHDAELASQLPGVDVVAVEFHPFALEPEREALPRARSRGVAVLARCPGPERLTAGPREVAAHRAEVADRLEQAFPDYRGHLAWLAFQFGLEGPGVSSVLMRVHTPVELSEVVDATGLPPMGSETARCVRRVALGLSPEAAGA